MSKIQLVRAMQSEHPLQTCDIGTLKANTSWALKKEVGVGTDLQQRLQGTITTCLSDVSQLSSRTKHACQQAVSQYLENLSVKHLDEDDKIILRYLNSPFSVQEIATAKKGSTPNPEEESTDDDDDCEASDSNKNSSSEFFTSLLIAIYKDRAPQEKKKMNAATAMCLFLQKAKAYLPPKTGT
ncbi:hypothetical protein BGZ74_004734, partial [Mortierella antarctica]